MDVGRVDGRHAEVAGLRAGRARTVREHAAHLRDGVRVQQERLAVGAEVKFFFSYLWIAPHRGDYETAAMDPAEEIFPALLGGEVTEVNDTAVKVAVTGGLGTVAVPRRWVFTDVHQCAEFYFSCMHLVEKGRIQP